MSLVWPEAKMLHIGPFRMAVRDVGSGPPVLLIHGLGSSSLVFARAFERLASRHRVIAVDLPGFGESAKPLYQFSLPFYAERLVRLLDELEVPSCIWAGHSMGAQIALWAALTSPRRVQGLVLTSPAGLETFSTTEQALLKSTVTARWVRRQSERSIREALASAFYRMPVEAEWLMQRRLQFRGPELEGYAHAFSLGVRGMLALPVRHRLQEVQQPTLILMGEQDALVPNRVFHPSLNPRRLVRNTAPDLRAEVVWLDKTGHLLPFERPVRFATTVSQFASRVAPQHVDVATHNESH